MNILLIGNGFDLAHGFPTSYLDFLEFCKMIKAVYTVNDTRHCDDVWKALNLKVEGERLGRLKNKFSELFSMATIESNWKRGNFIRTNTSFDELYDLIEANIWIEYFQKTPMYNKENWIDFESEISKVIQSLDKDMFNDRESVWKLLQISRKRCCRIPKLSLRTRKIEYQRWTSKWSLFPWPVRIMPSTL